MRDAKQAADRRQTASHPVPLPTPHAASPGLGIGPEDFLAIMAALTSLRTDVSGLSSWQDKLEARHQMEAEKDRPALPSQPLQRRVPVADDPPAATAAIGLPMTDADPAEQQRAPAFLYDPMAQPRILFKCKETFKGTKT